MQRDIFTPEHDAFRDMVRHLHRTQITPYHEQWERDGIVSRDVWLAAGRAELLGIEIDEKYGGGGNPDYRYYLILNEELAGGQRQRPGVASCTTTSIGHYLTGCARRSSASAGCPATAPASSSRAIAMTEPGRRQRPAGNPHDRGPRRRSLPAQRPRRPSSPTASCATS